MSLYRVEVWTRAGSLLADISQELTQRSFTVRRNRAESIDLTLDLYAAEQRARASLLDFNELFAEGSNEVRVYRGNRPLLGGTIYYVNPSIDETGASLQVKATGFLDLLKDRYLWPTTNANGVTTYTSTDIGAVMWGMINTTQTDNPTYNLTNSDFGIRLGTIQTSRALSDDWKPYATSIRDILIATTERINSVDMEFTYDKHFNIYYPGIGTNKTELLFSYPGNIKRFALPKDASGLQNCVISRGTGNGDVQLIEIRQDQNMQLAPARREAIIDNPSVSVRQTLDDFGDEAIRLYSASVKIPDIVLDGRKDPALGSYWIGDWVRFSVPQRSSYSILNGQTWRINEMTITPDAEDGEEVRLKVGLS